MDTNNQYIPEEQPVATATARNMMTIGLPKCSSATERRFPLTPEAAQILTERGFSVKIEKDAAETIHYTDNQYTRCGAEIVDRDEALRCDIVIHLAPIARHDAAKMRKGTMLLTFQSVSKGDSGALKELLIRGVNTIAIDLVEDDKGNHPFADILSEIDGRASMAIASSLLADSVHGKGILLGGVPGIVPCEALIIGSGDTACAAARAAGGLGAIVRMMDNDVYRLRLASRELGPGVIGSSLHPRGLASALRTADIVVVTDISAPLHFDSDDVDTMKRGVITFDLSHHPGSTFPSMPAVNLSESSALDNSFTRGTRVCYVNAGSAVPRTAAMALSNTFITMFADFIECQSSLNALKLMPGLQRAALTFMGRAVNQEVAERAGVRFSNLSLYLTLS